MTPLNRKLFRDLNRMRGQVLAISLVVASGVGVLVMSLSVYQSLEETANAYYERYHFADIFAGVKRAPERLAERAAAIPGVQTVQTRISRYAMLDMPDFDEPVMGRLVSIPEHGEPLLNKLSLQDGRFVSADRIDEVVVNEPFAEAHGLAPGSRFKALMNGKKRELTVVGIALSPEFVYALGPGALMPDDYRFGILWMGRDALAAAFDLDGAFNDISLTLLRGVPPEPVIQQLDAITDRYGSIGAIARADQLSNWFLMNEINQIRTMAAIMPTIFLAVAAFLSNMVVARLIATERTEIGLMKAFGYSNLEVGGHYMKLVALMTACGITLGCIVGMSLGRITTELYADFYRFPLLIYRAGFDVLALGAIFSLAASLIGTLSAVRQAAVLPPAEAMRPPEPPAFHRSGMTDGPLLGWLDQPTRIVIRQIGRVPVRSGLTSVGVALSVGIVIMAMQWLDSIDHLVQVYFMEGQRQDMMIGLVEAQSDTTVQDFRRMPGVLSAEPSRIVSVDFRSGARWHRGGISGVGSRDRLQRVYDASGYSVPVPEDGLVMSTKLAEKLDVGIGDIVQVDVLEGRRPVLDIPVVQTFETYIGVPAYINIDRLNQLLLDRPSIEYVNVLVDPRHEKELFAKLKDLPDVSSVALKQAAVDTFYETMAETLLIFVTFFASFAFALGFGVIYNSVRIALSERGRDLATLRVLGFTRWEAAYILLSEVSLLVVFALPLGILTGRLLAWIMTSLFETELFRVPLVIEASTYGYAMVLALIATAVSAGLVRRRLNALDMIAVLKTRE